MLAKSNLNSIETLVSQALIDMEISHKGFFTILKAKDKHEEIKENLKNVVVNMRLNSINSKKNYKFVNNLHNLRIIYNKLSKK